MRLAYENAIGHSRCFEALYQAIAKVVQISAHSERAEKVETSTALKPATCDKTAENVVQASNAISYPVISQQQ